MNLENELWSAANQLRANSELKASEYSYPVLGLIFLKYADYKFSKIEQNLNKKFSDKKRKITKDDFIAEGAMYLADKARFKYLLSLPEEENVGKKVDEAMLLIEKDNPDLKDTLPKLYSKFSKFLLIELLRLMDKVSSNIEGDAFGKIYEYFLGKFALSEGQKGGEFFTPTSIVKLIVNIIEPYKGKIYDPACGSGGMFVQSAHFVEMQKKNSSSNISVYGQERVLDTVKLNKLNLAVHSLGGDIKQGNAYYEDLHNSINKFDFVMANPPFNVKGVEKEKLKNDKRFIFGLPSVNNANYLWIQIFLSALNKYGRAGFVMGNSATDALKSEQEIRKKIINSGVVDIIISIASNFFYSVTLPCTLWFFDKNKAKDSTENKILFINATEIFTQIDKAHREFSEEQNEFLLNIIKMYRNKKLLNEHNSNKQILEIFKDENYKDIPGLCKVATIEEIKDQNWSLNPLRYVGHKIIKKNKMDYFSKITELNEKLNKLNDETTDLNNKVADNVNKILGTLNE